MVLFSDKQPEGLPKPCSESAFRRAAAVPKEPEPAGFFFSLLLFYFYLDPTKFALDFLPVSCTRRQKEAIFICVESSKLTWLLICLLLIAEGAGAPEAGQGH